APDAWRRMRENRRQQQVEATDPAAQPDGVAIAACRASIAMLPQPSSGLHEPARARLERAEIEPQRVHVFSDPRKKATQKRLRQQRIRWIRFDDLVPRCTESIRNAAHGLPHLPPDGSARDRMAGGDGNAQPALHGRHISIRAPAREHIEHERSIAYVACKWPRDTQPVPVL